MRVGIDIRWLQEAVANRALGGVGRYTLSLTARLLRHVDVVFLASPRSPVPQALLSTDENRNAETVAVPNCWRLPGTRLGPRAMRAMLADAAGVRAAVRRARVDVVHFMHQLSPPPKRLTCPSVVTVHDLAYLAHPRLFFGTERAPWLYRYRLHAIARADRLIAVSETTARDVKRLLGIPGSRIDVVHEAPESCFVPHGQPDASGAPYFVHVGGVGASKNLATLLQAYALLPQLTGQRARLVVVGVALEQLPQGMRDGVDVRPQLSDQELVAHYQGALALVFPSVVEGCGLPVLEAMACGTPVVTSSTTATAEVVGEAGILLNDPLDVREIATRMCQLMEDGELRARLSRAGLERARQFSWEMAAAQTVRVYREARG